jgi:hypothetical protein
MQASVEALADSADAAGEIGAGLLLPLLERLAQPFMALWGEHSNTSIVASLETVQTVQEWTALRDFIRRYGRDLFHVRFMTYGNLRGILHRGVGAYLDSLRDEPDPLHPVKLAEGLDRDIPRARAEHHLNTILRTLLENYEEFKDFNATSPLSDYGENLHILLDFLRLKAGYERHAWRVRPLTLVHEVLASRRSPAAELWAEQITRLTHGEAERHLQRLGQLEKAHGIRLRTVSDRLQERFVAPLALDRLCALVEPAMDAAGTPEADDALAELEQEAQSYLDNPTGVGLDLPHWLHRVEAAVHQVQGSRTVIATLAENLFKIPKVTVPVEDLRGQLDEWGTWMDRP